MLIRGSGSLILNAFISGGVGSLAVVVLFGWVVQRDAAMTSAVSTGMGLTGLGIFYCVHYVAGCNL